MLSAKVVRKVPPVSLPQYGGGVWHEWVHATQTKAKGGVDGNNRENDENSSPWEIYLLCPLFASNVCVSVWHQPCEFSAKWPLDTSPIGPGVVGEVLEIPRL